MNYLKNINELFAGHQPKLSNREKEKYEGIIGDSIIDLLDTSKAIISVNNYGGFKIIVSLNKIEFNSYTNTINNFINNVRENNIRCEKIISALPRIEKVGNITHIDVVNSSSGNTIYIMGKIKDSI